MILPDRGRVFTGGERQANGSITPTVDQGIWPCSVHPVRSDEVISYGGTTVAKYYRVIIGRSSPTPTPTGGYVLWRSLKLSVYGDVEQHSTRGRLHHREFTAKVG